MIYSWDPAFCRFEGTLGIVTRITLRLLPKPEARKTMLVAFEIHRRRSPGGFGDYRGKIIPTTLEFMDGSAIDCCPKATALGDPDH